MRVLSTFLLITLSVLLCAQENFDIRFSVNSVSCTNNQVCYDVQLRSSNASQWGLGGQNYRIFYDYSKAQYASGTSVLPSAYGGFTLVADQGPVDASGFPNPFSFDATLGFLNYAIDLSDVTNGGVDLTTQWLSTSTLCFNVEPSVINDPNECLELIWARDGLTQTLATAFVEVSEWVSSNVTQGTTGSLYDDLDSSDGDDACFSVTCSSELSISDASVNEGAGQVAVSISLASPAPNNVLVSYVINNGTAIQGSDFSAANGTVLIPAGATSASVSVSIIDDTVVEPSETFTITISSADATVTDSEATVTIIDNDVACAAQAPTISGS